MPERRREPRFESDLSVIIWGVDANGMPFAQNVFARNISSRGALLSGFEQEVRCGDLVMIQYRDKQARFRVVWTRASGDEAKTRIAVQRLESDPCPWSQLLDREALAAT